MKGIKKYGWVCTNKGGYKLVMKEADGKAIAAAVKVCTHMTRVCTNMGGYVQIRVGTSFARPGCIGYGSLISIGHAHYIGS